MSEVKHGEVRREMIHRVVERVSKRERGKGVRKVVNRVD